MRYEKPRIMDLNGRSVDGQVQPDVCQTGATAQGLNLNGCGTGTGPAWGEDCATGTAPSAYSGGYCAPGHSVGSGGGCYSGGTAGLCTSGGSVPAGAVDFGCTVGPSFV